MPPGLGAVLRLATGHRCLVDRYNVFDLSRPPLHGAASLHYIIGLASEPSEPETLEFEVIFYFVWGLLEGKQEMPV